MQTFIDFIQSWGYWAVFLGSLVEGESVILTATFLAYNGYLSLIKIMIVAFIGTFLAEQICYILGRHYGMKLFDKFPKFKPAADKAFYLLKKWDIWFILTCRFIYGIRTLSPFVIGAAGVPPRRYLPLNIIAALIWVVISCVGGYLLGGTVEKIINHIDHAKYFILFGFIGLVALGVFIAKKKIRKLIDNEGIEYSTSQSSQIINPDLNNKESHLDEK